ncbi:C40 family peptidase [Curtobacterium sp. MCPF17_051]|uniref:C40 family peptidase n=1 Tax=Curtobacterium sp. MCPF17_051 TaxID=2175640 RepID=UPI000DAAA29A|nr:NlpC/P60 family protein [Curtobacterium sp. MCPF17_051]PZF30944.1 hypothetical protein DEJ35_08320 [Curtobacterium sp. MCPF17_051]
MAPAPSSPSKAAGAISYARGQLGKAYVLGGAGPNTWDCSGLVMMAYSSQGIATGGHNVVWQYNYFKSIGRLVPLSQRQPGDILFYSSNGTASGAYHDSIVTSYGTMVEAARPAHHRTAPALRMESGRRSSSGDRQCEPGTYAA